MKTMKSQTLFEVIISELKNDTIQKYYFPSSNKAYQQYVCI